MSILTEPLPTSLDGAEISADFRTMLRYEQLLFDNRLSAQLKIQCSLALFYPHGYTEQKTWKDAWLGLQWFHRCGKDAQPSAERARRMAQRAYDFEQDAPLILAAFQQAYGIDLTSAQLHWWHFRALFDNLPADCRLCKIMEYRVADTSELPERTRAIYEKMRRLYALDRHVDPELPMTVEEHNAQFIARLRREG